VSVAFFADVCNLDGTRGGVNYALMAGAFLPALHIGRDAAAAALTPLDSNDPAAKSQSLLDGNSH
jgi:hypothetical protein